MIIIIVPSPDYENNLPKKLLRFSFIASLTVTMSSDITFDLSHTTSLSIGVGRSTVSSMSL
ncbi:hypothetical protein [Capnocytophaga leadbetteri]